MIDRTHTDPSIPMIGILLCTYNGEAFLKEQLESFLAQTHERWRLFVSDDCSTDGTEAILNHYQCQLGEQMVVLKGPQKGFAQNFMSLIRNPAVRCDAYAFSDQDDIWMPDKLSRSIAIPHLLSDIPCLYCSRSQLVDAHGQRTGLSPLFRKHPSFKNALVQSIAGANTMLINEATRKLLALTGIETPIVAHDWLTYLVVSGCGGSVVYDPEPTLLYRQHTGNLIGANIGIRSKLTRISKMLNGRFKGWNEKNLSILRKYSSDLTPENRLLLNQFDRLRTSNIFGRLKLLRTAGFYRQTRAGTISLYVAVVLKRV